MSSLKKRRSKRSGPQVPSVSSIDDSSLAASSQSSESITHEPSIPNGTYLISAIVWIIVFIVYTVTAFPSVSGGDSGELIITGCNLGLAHPPGYPLFTMLARFFINILPFGMKAWRVNMCSVVCGSTAAGFLCATTHRLTQKLWPGIVCSFGFAFSHTVWLYSIQGEVFALNNMLCSIVIFLTVGYYQSLHTYHAKDEGKIKNETEKLDTQTNIQKGQTAEKTKKKMKDVGKNVPFKKGKGYISWACAGAFFCGLAMTNQHTTVFLVIPTVLMVLLSLLRPWILRGSDIFLLCLSIIAGMLPYIYLPIAAQFKPMDGWGDPRTVAGFMHHFLRKEYGTFQLAATGLSEDPGMVSRLAVYIRILFSESLYVTPVLCLIGFCAIFFAIPSIRRSGYVYVASYVVYTLVFHKLANLDLNPLFLGVQARFWMQSNMYVFLFAAYGLWYISTKVEQFLTKQSVVMIFWFIAVVYASLQCGVNYRSNDNHSTMTNYHNGAIPLQSFPPNSLVLLNGDINNNLFKYAQQCEGIRPDVQLLSVQLMTWDWFMPMQRDNYRGVKFPGHRYHPKVAGGFSLRQFLAANYKKFSIFLCGPYKEHDNSHVNHYTELPWGPCHQIVKNKDKEPKNWSEYLTTSYEALPTTAQLGGWNENLYTNETWEKVVFHDMWHRRMYLASFISFNSNQDAGNIPLLALAKRVMDDIFDDGDHEQLLTQKGIIPDNTYREAGIIFGQWSKVVLDRGGPNAQEEINQLEDEMMRLWGIFGDKKGEESDLKHFVIQGINPYIGRPIHSTDASPFTSINNDGKKKKKKRKKKKKKKKKKKE